MIRAAIIAVPAATAARRPMNSAWCPWIRPKATQTTATAAAVSTPEVMMRVRVRMFTRLRVTAVDPVASKTNISTFPRMVITTKSDKITPIPQAKRW